MDFIALVMVVVLLMAASVGARELINDGGCEAPPLFIFGASYMDVGENSAAMPFRSVSEYLPYGMDFPAGPSGRMSNGRLIVDHVSELMGYGHIDPYLKTVGADFRHGVNFASSGSKACNSSITGDGSSNNGLFSLSVQVDQFRVFRHQTLSMYQNKKRKNVHELLPSPRGFSNGVYILETGNNDFAKTTPHTFEAMSELVLSSIHHAIRELYNEGARIFLVWEAFPVECYPIKLGKTTKGELNEDGCLAQVAINNKYHNTELGKLLGALEVELVGAKIVYFHIHEMMMEGIRNPSKYGLKAVRRACCGYGGGEYNWNGIVNCGQEEIVDGEWQKYTLCENRSEYMMWDAMHTTDAFNFHIAQALVKGEYMTPPFSIKEMCRHQKQ